MKYNDDRMRDLFAEAIYKESRLDKALCDEVAFHVIDFKDELFALCQLMSDPGEFSSKQTMQIIQAYLVYATEHSIAASELLLGYKPENIFGSS